ncbi:efflux RND transporter periplasmic adaptor subunit [Thalassomonas sp. M1454]|uniref:efflux RND transporter periplasmic adaptor subunit n=1 Tax=Thalassomonas sp. M1454 TaxID=2594477 RepID=UPI00117D13EB|nr:efflux RND transporter periplasmic adaptor subunit [Thalassomonas sp. M1454]TRX53096.1 efflux RND transporter periplasmic adaptor subunit [Thalassomonas sp. M1454]
MRFKVLGISSLLVLLVTGCGEQQKKVAAPVAAPEVGVLSMQYEKLNLVAKYPGKTEAMSTVQISTEIRGKIIASNVVEGANVKRGQVLFRMDPKPFEAKVANAKSALEQAKAEVALAEVKNNMSESLASENVLSKLDAEQVKVDLDVAKAAMAAAQATLVSAELNLKKTSISSPIDGVVGLTDVSVGEIKGPLSGPLVEITANQFVQVYSQIGEKEHFENMLDLQERTASQISTLELELPNGAIYEHEGQLDYIGNEVSPTSGTVTYRLIFPNPQGLLLSGQNVTVVATDKRKSKFFSIPQKAVQEDQSGRYVLVVDENNVAQKRYLTLGDRFESNWIVKKGLNEGELVITTGILRAKPGKPVSPIKQ